jgi:hypothetical protein
MFFSAEEGPLCRRAWLRRTAAFLMAIPCAAQEPRSLPPPGDPPGDSGLSALLERMRKIVASKDAAALTALMLPEFKVEFDVGKGPLVFRRHWKPEAPDSEVWEVLGKALALQGASYLPTLFCVPYVYKSFPRDLDPLTHVVATGADATLRDRPAKDGAVLGTRDHAIIPLAEPLQPPVVIRESAFLAVNDTSAGRCFVSGSQVYSPAGHRMFFERRNGKWQWISLAAETLAEPPELKSHLMKG